MGIYTSLRDIRRICKGDSTVWNELCNAMVSDMPFRPRFAVKYKAQSGEPIHHAEDINWGYAWWDELGRNGHSFSEIEYLLVRSYQIKAIHQYAKPEVIDGSEKLEEILNRLSFRYTCNDGIFQICAPT